MLRISIANKAGQDQFEHAQRPIELGRHPRLPKPQQIQDPYVGNDQLRVEELSGERVRLENMHKKFSINLADGTSLDPGASRETDLPVRLFVGQTIIDIEQA